MNKKKYVNFIEGTEEYCAKRVIDWNPQHKRNAGPNSREFPSLEFDGKVLFEVLLGLILH